MIEVTYYYGKHEGGTKNYRLYQFHSLATRNSMIVKSWGKLGTDGQCKIEMVGSAGEKAFNSALKERQSKGYDMRLQKTDARTDITLAGIFNELRDALRLLPTKHQQSIFINQLAQLDPASFDSNARDNYDPFSAARAATIKVATAPSQEEIDLEAAELQSHPLYGMF